ncbi:flagellar biosynthesis protein FlhF [Acidithiobacillus thiooxidans]|jgi:flagellar biosynthesis protein FlhF|uniref:Flagellar biosynthesis protein FlhF n=1 Tax=Acidithiobacillus thiooxidans ATCC 19377 TaxID=637390 RepID=A0A543Q7V4_ACITH|nr:MULTISPECIES: flagellar biosynthesis protein FlhF [Acidithiobacillus]MBU2842944.1 flagellar biosynthesis protein FlhF [Acidithiobacillus thiooxidans]MDR7927830.1 flagellar biosynthesis protein FlhF [Acidithiobacillus thiooxidans]MDX5936082.1 flagellar biosynthesis protein FlhF [Acidithiobacillus thiooxidans]TQN52412.1 Flagellar biosynthesis protein FlhF [Acidithiobacillus thiooxidans ATCC 19377]
MKIKRFSGANTREVLQQIRLTLGPDAVILSNRESDGEVEIVAAIDFEEKQWNENQSIPAWPEPLRTNPEKSEAFQPSQILTQGAAIAPPQPSVTASHRDLSHPQASAPLRDELQALKQLVERRWGAQPVQQSAQSSLTEMGFSEAWIAEFLEQEQSQEWEPALLRILQEKVGISQASLEKPGLFILMGPTGSGKTTSIAKLAAAQVLRHGPHSVALLTTDTYRIAGVEQLDIYARILGVPLDVIKGPEDLLKSLEKHRDRSWIFIDTIGMGPKDPRLNEQLQWFAALGTDAQRFLLIPASLSGRNLSAVLQPYTDIPLSGAIISKVDETPAFAAVLEWLAAQHLPVAWYSDGQRVPEDMHEAPWEQLMNLLKMNIVLQKDKLAVESGSRYHGAQL